MSDLVIRSAYQRTRTPINLSSGGRTKQSFKDECDVNQVMRQWERTGQIGHVSEFTPQYGDFTNVDDYHAAVNQVNEAEAQFDALPAKIRKQMHNDPRVLMAFLDDPANEDLAIEMGLLPPKPTLPEKPDKLQQELAEAGEKPPTQVEPRVDD